VGGASVRAKTEIDWSDVRPRIAALGAAHRHREGFWRKLEWIGSWTPPLTAKELIDLASQLRISLPAEYRSFLLQVSRGGAGPAYGLFSLRCVDGRWRWEGLHDKLLYDPAHSAGLLNLCHLGCAVREALVVSGLSRGQMWADNTADEEGFHPPQAARVGFAARVGIDGCGEQSGGCAGRATVTTESAGLRPPLPACHTVSRSAHAALRPWL
jgi:hypothetical protein